MSEIPGITPDGGRLRPHGGGRRPHRGDAPPLRRRRAGPRRSATSASSLARACIAQEFTVLATGRTSPVIGWLRALAAEEHKRCGGPGVGAVGMCFTGGFALGMMVDDVVVAPVLSQPSLPFPCHPADRRDLGCPAGDVPGSGSGPRPVARCSGCGSPATGPAPPSGSSTSRQLLGDGFIGVELDSSPGQSPRPPQGGPLRAHRGPRRPARHPDPGRPRPGPRLLHRAARA